MGQHHNPMDPRDPLSPAFYYTFVDNGNGGPGGGRGSGSGGGCMVLLIVFALTLVIGSLTSR